MFAPNRRLFVVQALQLAGVTLLAKSSPAISAASPDSQPNLLPRMQWLNEPPSWAVEEGRLTVAASTAKADFYRLPGWSVDNGNFFHLPVAGDFIFQARIGAEFAARYDQAGLMVRLDAENWVKCGSELVDGQRLASVVFTRKYSDWSTMKDLSDTAAIWWQIVRWKESIKTLCSLDGRNFIVVREGYFPGSARIEVGLLCASLEGRGVKAVFDSPQLSAL